MIAVATLLAFMCGQSGTLPEYRLELDFPDSLSDRLDFGNDVYRRAAGVLMQGARGPDKSSMDVLTIGVMQKSDSMDYKISVEISGEFGVERVASCDFCNRSMVADLAIAEMRSAIEASDSSRREDVSEDLAPAMVSGSEELLSDSMVSGRRWGRLGYIGGGLVVLGSASVGGGLVEVMGSGKERFSAHDGFQGQGVGAGSKLLIGLGATSVAAGATLVILDLLTVEDRGIAVVPYGDRNRWGVSAVWRF